MFTQSLFLIFFGVIEVFTANILYLNPITSKSHHLWNKVLIKGLAGNGHNITMVSVDDDENPPSNVHYIYLEAAYDTLHADEDDFLLDLAELGYVQSIIGLNEWCQLSCEGAVKSKGLKNILNYPDDFKFDLVIQDFGCGPCLLPLMHKFKNPPLVSVTAFSNPPFSNHLTGGQKFPATVPHYAIDYPQFMNFPQRIFNTFLYIVDFL